MIPSPETERMWARPARLEDAEQVQKIFPQWENEPGLSPASTGRCASRVGGHEGQWLVEDEEVASG
jgi:hypothetical protein